MMDDMKKDDMGGKGSGKGSCMKKDMGGKGSGQGGKRPGGRRLMGKGPKGQQGGNQQGGNQQGGKGPKDQQGGGGKGPMGQGGEKQSGKGPMGQSGKGPMGQSGKGPRGSGSGKGPMGQSGKGPMGSGSGKPMGSGQRRVMTYCGPKMEKQLKTGLPVTVTLYTDEECTEMLQIPEQRRRLVTEKDFEGKKPGSGMMKGSGRGEMKKDMGGNDRQNKRVRENPTKRMIPVVDGLGNPKCSFDAGADRMRGRFRKTTCMQDNALAMTVYDDVLCEHESEMPGKILFRDECMPLEKMEGGEKKDEGKGGKGGKDGRRLLE